VADCIDMQLDRRAAVQRRLAADLPVIFSESQVPTEIDDPKGGESGTAPGGAPATEGWRVELTEIVRCFFLAL
jgi:hypothetical protein